MTDMISERYTPPGARVLVTADLRLHTEYEHTRTVDTPARFCCMWVVANDAAVLLERFVNVSPDETHRSRCLECGNNADITDENEAMMCSLKHSLPLAMSQLQQAYWHYVDQMEDGKWQWRKKRCSFSAFLNAMSEFLAVRLPQFRWCEEGVVSNMLVFNRYCRGAPRCGCILVSDDGEEVVMVQGAGRSGSWNFPGGRREDGEPEESCARRETVEETGYDPGPIDGALHPTIRYTFANRLYTFFVVFGVSRFAHFRPRCTWEIRRAVWQPLHAVHTLNDTERMDKVVDQVRQLLLERSCAGNAPV